MYTLPKVLLHYLDHKKRHILNCSTLEELLKEAKGLFKIEENSKVFVQRFDETWNVEVDVELLDEVKDRDKLILIHDGVCSPSKTEEKVRYCF